MSIADFVNKHKDSIDKALDAVESTIDKAANERDPISRQQQKLDIEDAVWDGEYSSLMNICTGTVSIRRETIERYLPDGVSITMRDGSIWLDASKVKTRLVYHSSCFDDTTKSVTFEVLEVKPFYKAPFLSRINQEAPGLEYEVYKGKKLITCDLGKAPYIKDSQIVQSKYLKYLTIRDVKIEDDNLLIRAGIKAGNTAET